MKAKYLVFIVFFSMTTAYCQLVGGIQMANATAENGTTNTTTADCDVEFAFQTDTTIPYGLAFDGTYFYTTSLQESFIQKYTLDGQAAGTIPFPPTSLGYYLGDLDFDGTSLWLMAEQQGTLYQLNPANGDILHAYVIDTAADPNYFGCAYDNGSVYVCDYNTNQVRQVDAATGAIVSTFAAPAHLLPLKIIHGDLYGVAYNNSQLYQLDKTTGAALSSSPWCISVTPTGLTMANDHVWGLQKDTHTIKRFLGNLALESAVRASSADILVAPNPTTQFVTITAKDPIVALALWNSLGQCISKTNGTSLPTSRLDLSTFQNGVYFLQITTSKGLYFKKISKR